MRYTSRYGRWNGQVLKSWIAVPGIQSWSRDREGLNEEGNTTDKLRRLELHIIQLELHLTGKARLSLDYTTVPVFLIIGV